MRFFSFRDFRPSSAAISFSTVFFTFTIPLEIGAVYDRFAHPFFVTFTALSYQYVYGNLYGALEDMFVEPYPDLIRRMFDRRDPDFSLLSSLSYPATGMLYPLYYDDIVTDPEHPLNQDLRDNDVYDWIPLAPVRLFYCGGDERVPYENSIGTTQFLEQLLFNNSTMSAL